MRRLALSLDPEQAVPGTGHIHQRALGAVARAGITNVDDTQKMQVVTLSIMFGEDGFAAERAQEYGFSSVPFDGAEAIPVFVHGNRGLPLVIAVDDRRYRPKGLKPGESAQYDDQGQMLYISRDGIIVNGNGKPVTFRNAPTVSMDGNLEVAGEVTAKFNTDGSVTLSGHKTSGVTPGAGESAAPVGGT
jgi:phage gp45-like